MSIYSEADRNFIQSSLLRLVDESDFLSSNEKILIAKKIPQLGNKIILQLIKIFQEYNENAKNKIINYIGRIMKEGESIL